ncbi:MAG: hypothetical protein AAGM67_18275 [Bacteroidota bacterium]
MDIDLKDLITIVGAIIAVAGSHFNLRTRILVLEERLSGHSETVERIERSLRRIEEKLDGKADR